MALNAMMETRVRRMMPARQDNVRGQQWSVLKMTMHAQRPPAIQPTDVANHPSPMALHVMITTAAPTKMYVGAVPARG